MSRFAQLKSRLFPDAKNAPPTNLTRSIFLRALGFVFLCAFSSAAVQADGLLGSRGITPISGLFAYARAQLHFYELPSLFWWSSSDAALHAVCWAGALLSVALMLGVAPRLVLVLLWALYLSITTAGDVFMQFQWDLLLLETAVLSVLFAPWTLLLRRDQPAPQNHAGMWLLRLLLFRLMFSSGLVKLASHDPAWRDFTALDYHYWTQPLPGPLSAAAHFVPSALKQLECVLMFVIELLVPFFIFAPRKLRQVAFVLLVGLQVGILTTGNYGFFNLLTIVLCIPLLDDEVLLRFLPSRLFKPHAQPTTAPTWRTRSAAVLVAIFAVLGMSDFFSRLGFRSLVPRPLVAITEALQPFASINSYGLFAVMTKTRPEIILEGSDDGADWKTYELPYKPGDVNRSPPFLLGHMPRLDWMMWFASLGSCRSNAWFIQLQDGLLRGSTDAAKLYEVNPFPTAPPHFLRSTTWEYRFSTPEEKRNGAPFWTRTLSGPFCPTLTLQNGNLAVVPQ